MRFAAIALLLVSLFTLAAQQKQKQKQKKPPDVQVLETRARREDTRITLDGKVRVTGDKPLKGLVSGLDFRSPEKEVVTTQKTVVEEETLEIGREGAYHVEMADTARAVRYEIRAFDFHEKELRVSNTGPFPIE